MEKGTIIRVIGNEHSKHVANAYIGTLAMVTKIFENEKVCAWKCGEDMKPVARETITSRGKKSNTEIPFIHVEDYEIVKIMELQDIPKQIGNLKCVYCGYVLTPEDSDMMCLDFCPMCEKKRAINLCPDCSVYCEKRFEDGRCE